MQLPEVELSLINRMDSKANYIKSGHMYEDYVTSHLLDYEDTMVASSYKASTSTTCEIKYPMKFLLFSNSDTI